MNCFLILSKLDVLKLVNFSRSLVLKVVCELFLIKYFIFYVVEILKVKIVFLIILLIIRCI